MTAVWITLVVCATLALLARFARVEVDVHTIVRVGRRRGE